MAAGEWKEAVSIPAPQKDRASRTTVPDHEKLGRVGLTLENRKQITNFPPKMMNSRNNW